MTIEELQAYFQGIDIPEQIELVTGVVIEDVALFLQSHFDYIKDNPGLKSTDIFLKRLNDVQGILDQRA
jgi:hypothetical protein